MRPETAQPTETELNYDKIMEAFTITSHEVNIAELQEKYRAAVLSVKEMAIPYRNKRNIIESLYYSMRDEVSSSVSIADIWSVLYPSDGVVETADQEA